jgi:hypothetical protein
VALTALALSWLLQHPQAAASGAAHMTRPGIVDTSAMQQSFADLSRGVLNCYHRTARYVVADVIQAPFDRQAQYAAEQSAVVRITYTGISGAQYQMFVAVMAKQNAVRAAVLADSAAMRYSRKCELEQWTVAQ